MVRVPLGNGLSADRVPTTTTCCAPPIYYLPYLAYFRATPSSQQTIEVDREAVSAMSDRRQYDSRREGRSDRRRGRPDDNDDGDRRRADRSRSRSRSNSPPRPAKKSADDFEEERRARMARLRQEMQEEDRELAALDQPETQDPKQQPQKEIIEVNQEELEGLDEEEQMKMLLGFSGGFGSTKGEAVEDNQSSAARGAAAKNKARKYRQYMNRKNGFNRPLDKMD